MMKTKMSDWVLGKVPSTFLLLLVLAQCPLFLSMLHYLLLHVEAFATAHAVRVFQSLVLRVCFLTKVQVFFFCGGNPVGITADHLMHRGGGREEDD